MKLTNQTTHLGRLPGQTKTAQSTSQTAGSAAPSLAQDAIQSGKTGQLLPTPAISQQPPTGLLSGDQLTQLAGVGGKGLKGFGELQGEIAIVTRAIQDSPGSIGRMEERALLITANKGTRSQVAFELDMPIQQAKSVAGQTISISGDIEKATLYNGKINGARLGETFGLKPGSWAQLSGKILNKSLMAIGGEAPPQGSYLQLADPIIVGGKKYGEVFVAGPQFPDGAELKLSGRLDVSSFGGVETPLSHVIRLTGISNQTAGEPAFDGKKFTSAITGKELDVLSYTPPHIADIPSTIFVLDQGQDKAFVGAMGGFIPQHMNPFHGYRDVRSIEAPTQADKNAVKFDAQGAPVDATSGKALALISLEEPPPGTADMYSHAWYLNEDSGALYRFTSGGFAGLVNQMDQVVRPNPGVTNPE